MNQCLPDACSYRCRGNGNGESIEHYLLGNSSVSSAQSANVECMELNKNARSKFAFLIRNEDKICRFGFHQNRFMIHRNCAAIAVPTIARNCPDGLKVKLTFLWSIISAITPTISVPEGRSQVHHGTDRN
jgi:hypothetical protein